MFTNIVNCDLMSLDVDEGVEVVFHITEDAKALIRFRRR
jgi:hypothetical protein